MSYIYIIIERHIFYKLNVIVCLFSTLKYVLLCVSGCVYFCLVTLRGARHASSLSPSGFSLLTEVRTTT